MNPVNFDKAVFTDLGAVQPQDLDLSTLEYAARKWDWHDLIAAADMPEALADAEVMVSNKVWLGARQLAMAPKLKPVCVAATGALTIAVTRRLNYHNVRFHHLNFPALSG